MKGRGRPLTTLKGFIGRVDDLERQEDHEYFFRGHSDKDGYFLTPSVFRKPAGRKNEHNLYRELISTNPAEFRDDDSCLERLARMQHHSCPTRLLDVSSNPLVALYFACGGNQSRHGEVIALQVRKDIVKFFDSDTVSCIANMARLPWRSKRQLIRKPTPQAFRDCTEYKRLLHFIREEKPYFEPKIVQEHLKSVVIVRPKLSNQRLLAQAGAFVLFGQVEKIDDYPIDGVSISRIIIDAASKANIRDSLQSLNINEGSLYLDIDSYARHLRRQFALKQRHALGLFYDLPLVPLQMDA